VHLPKLTLPVEGITISHKCANFVDSSWFERLASFLDRHPTNPLWYAPQDALKDGKVQPLSHQAETWLIRNQSGKVKKISSLGPMEREWVAWRWLIISFNVLHPTSRIAMNKRLSVHYERKGTSSMTHSGKEGTDMASVMSGFRDSLKSILEDVRSVPEGHVAFPTKEYSKFMEKSLETIIFLGDSWAMHVTGEGFVPRNDKPGCTKRCAAMNEWMEAANALESGRAIPAVIPADTLLAQAGPALLKDEPDLDNQEVQNGESASVEDIDEPPESFDSEGRQWFREDIDLLDCREGQIYYTMEKFGAVYRALGAVPGSSKQAAPLPTPPPPPKQPAQGKLKEKTALVREPSPASSGKKKGKLPAVPQTGTPPEEGETQRAHPVQQDNPLGVTGGPKSKALLESQRLALRKFFELKEGLVPAVEWSLMDNKARAASLKERSIPRWATAAVLRDPENLPLILSGKLNKDNAAVPSRKSPSSHSAARALEAWQQLKSDFQGVTLFRNPATAKEKAFKRRFDQLVVEYGTQQCFPKPKDRPDQQGRTGPRGGGRQGGDMEGLLSMARAFGEIARALRA
jgi:hypothetical protein